jgi:alpha-tubulin suppressor-like RCC1 family protein
MDRKGQKGHKALAALCSGIATSGLLLSTLSPDALAAGPVSPGATPARVVTAGTSTEVYSFGVVGGDGKMRELEHEVPTPVVGLPGDVVQVATSNSDGYALTTNGSVWAWGAGGLGELGDGARPRFVGLPVEVRFPPGVKITSLANPMPYNSGLAIDSQGNAWGWGYNPQHALCLSGGPILWPTPLPLSDVTQASGAGDHSLLESGGKVYACGRGSAGELGDGATLNRPVPTPVVGLPPGSVEALTSSWQGSGVLMDDGTYYDWGYNRQGQLGDGTTTDSDLPVQVPLPAPVSQVWQGGSNSLNGQTLALLADGTIWAWGAGSLGQLGDGTFQGSTLPVAVDAPEGVQFAKVCSGGDTSYAIDTSGNVWAWGGNGFGQLGNGTSGVPDYIPAPVNVSLLECSATATNVVGLSWATLDG